MGAAGFLPKSLAKSGLVNAIRLVLGGEKFIPSEILSEIRLAGERDSNDDDKINSEGPIGKLTERERQVLKELIIGLQNKEIARNLEIQEVTVKLHVKNIYKKLGASNRAHAVKISYDLGWAQKQSV